MPASRPDVVDPELAHYIAAHSTPPDRVQRQLMEATEQQTGGASIMQIGGDQGTMFELLARATGARSAIEIGTFTGYSALSLARGMGPDGRLICCDVSEEWTAIARRHWAMAGLDHRIDLRIAPALDTLRALPEDERFDLAFVDADKGSYTAYVDALVPRLRAGGLLLIDNVLWGGAVVRPDATDDDTLAIRSCNDHVAAHPDLESLILPFGDGLTLARKRA